MVYLVTDRSDSAIESRQGNILSDRARQVHVDQEVQSLDICQDIESKEASVWRWKAPPTRQLPTHIHLSSHPTSSSHSTQGTLYLALSTITPQVPLYKVPEIIAHDYPHSLHPSIHT